MRAASKTVLPVMDISGTHVTAASVEVETRSILPGQSFREPLDADGSADEIPSALGPRPLRLVPARPARKPMGHRAAWAIRL
jgi:glucokinase